MSQDEPVPVALQRLLTKEHPFAEFHREWRLSDRDRKKGTKSIKTLLERFLRATMDEVRTSMGRQAARSIARMLGLVDFTTVFRDAVLRRELAGRIDYSQQRDHSTHTVYNYLLGWYFFVHSAVVCDAFAPHFQYRGVSGEGSKFPLDSRENFFGSVWQYASLFHDVGYMFEGTIPALGFQKSSNAAALGAEVAQEYFNRTVWTDHDLEQRDIREQFFNDIGKTLPRHAFEDRSLGGIADELRHLGDLGLLNEHILSGLPQLDHDPCLNDVSDAFDLWIRHYAAFGQSRMGPRIASLRRVFNGLIDRGMPGGDVRLLDHGVCSGLLLLLASTYYYQLRAAVESAKKKTRRVAELRKLGWSPVFWWTGIVWATAATALHNVQQMEGVASLDVGWRGKLAIKQDPLAYLGVLVDTIQEWDRPAVFRKLERKTEPLQGIDVSLGTQDGKVVLKYLGDDAHDRGRRMRRELGRVLKQWNAVLVVQP